MILSKVFINKLKFQKPDVNNGNKWLITTFFSKYLLK
jgi:hypothetical protein